MGAEFCWNPRALAISAVACVFKQNLSNEDHYEFPFLSTHTALAQCATEALRAYTVDNRFLIAY